MQNDRVSEEISLRDACPIRLDDALGTRVICLQGRIWITTAGEAEDIFLRPGDSYRIRRNGLSLVESIEHGSIRLEQGRFGHLSGNWLGRLVSRLTGCQKWAANGPDQLNRTARAASAPGFPA